MSKLNSYDVVVIGGGHAGCEAYAAACRIGVSTALIVPSFNMVGVQPCNPAVGGPGKGHLVREIVALGGVMGKVTDRSGIQFRTLNQRKGPAVRSTRVQTDSAVYVEQMKIELGKVGKFGVVIEDFVTDLVWKGTGSGRQVTGVQLSQRGFLAARTVVITTGTFLRGVLFMGKQETPGGRQGAKPSIKLAESLQRTGLPMMRLKTGTCPRIAGDSIDVTNLEEQYGDEPAPFFSPDTNEFGLPQRMCHLTYTGDECHAVIRDNLEKSAMYGGGITGIGPRYCPSIETKIDRFPDKVRHQVFLEPEDKDGKLIYPAGLSTSFPPDVQEKMIHSIDGLENAKIVKYGYAVEYDAVQPQCLAPHLEVDGFAGLFLAGQILGTSGYEEAAALGLLAGANAALSVRGDTPIVLARDQAYAGVMIDDLTGRGVDEPYRMFTSRAEYRLLLREDNADERLLQEGLRTGLIPEDQAKRVSSFLDHVTETSTMLHDAVLTPTGETNDKLRENGFKTIKKPTSLYEVARRESVSVSQLAPFAPWAADLSGKVQARIDVDIKYSGYLARQAAQAERLRDVDRIMLPKHMTFDGIPGLRGEIVEKLTAARPSTLGQVSRIPGVTPAAVEILRVFCQKIEMETLESKNK